jgi:23S rRNA (cytosine1962-C5)-methyltransferase
MQEKLTMFYNRLVKVFRHVSKQAKKLQVSCYRVYDHDLPEFPFCIEVYEDKVYLAEYRRHHHMSEEEHGIWLEQCLPIISDVTSIAVEKIYLRERKRKSDRQDQYEKLNMAQDFFIVKESGLNFKVNLTDYLDSGLFLDHRITRGLIRDESKKKNVLNLFCYTGSFSVYAASGGASQVTSVDLSKTYLNWAKENMSINDLLDDKKHSFIHADVKQYLWELPKNLFDLVIMDPPTFSNSKRMKDFLDIQRDHAALINQTITLMKPSGVLYFSTNFSKFVLDQHSISASGIKDITRATTPFDFQGKLSRYCFRISI